jgi:hypothetical protein
MINNSGVNVHADKTKGISLWFVRLLIGAVFFFNVQCALAFIFTPEAYTPAFELSGAPGAGMVRGMGILFLMWNVPYAFALWNPLHYRISLLQAVIMQTMGVIGETLLLVTFPAGYAVVRAAVLRFIIFDAAGLGMLFLAGMLVLRSIHKQKQGSIKEH